MTTDRYRWLIITNPAGIRNNEAPQYGAHFHTYGTDNPRQYLTPWEDAVPLHGPQPRYGNFYQ